MSAYVPFKRTGTPKPSLMPTDPYAFGGAKHDPTLTNMYATGQMGGDMGKGTMALPGMPTMASPTGGAGTGGAPPPPLPVPMPQTQPSVAGTTGLSPNDPYQKLIAGDPLMGSYATGSSGGANAANPNGGIMGTNWEQNALALGVLPMGQLGTPQASGGAAPSGMAMPTLPGMPGASPGGFAEGAGSMNNMLAMATGGPTAPMLDTGLGGSGGGADFDTPGYTGGLIGNGNEMSQWSQAGDYQGSGGAVKAAQDEAANGGGTGPMSPFDEGPGGVDINNEQDIADEFFWDDEFWQDEEPGQLPPYDPSKTPTGVVPNGGGSVGGVQGTGGNSNGTGIAVNPNSGIPMGPGSGYTGGGANGNNWNPYIGYNPNSNQVPGTSYTGGGQNPTPGTNIGINLPYNPTGFGGGNQQPTTPRDQPSGSGGSSSYSYNFDDSFSNQDSYGYSKPVHTFDPQNAEQYVSNIGRENLPDDLRYSQLMDRDPLSGLRSDMLGREAAPEREYTQQMAREAANEANALLSQGLNTRMESMAGEMGGRGMGSGGAMARMGDLARKETLGQQASNIRQALEGAARYGDDFNRDIFGKNIEQRGQDTAFLSQLNDAINARSSLGVQQRGQDVDFASKINQGALDLSAQGIAQRGQDIDQQQIIASIVNNLLGQTNKVDASQGRAGAKGRAEAWSNGSGGGGVYAGAPDTNPYGQLNYLNPFYW